jgi:hypothetical protein
VKTCVKLFLLAGLMSVVSATFAQDDVAAVTGTVTDTTGAAIPNAAVEVASASTGSVRTTVTSGAGTYYVGDLAIGTYQLKVNAPRFSTEQISDIELVVGQTRSLNVKLQIGSVAQQVNVVDTSAALTTTTAEIGGVIEKQQIKDLPLNGRNVASLSIAVARALAASASRVAEMMTRTSVWMGSTPLGSGRKIRTPTCVSRSRPSRLRSSKWRPSCTGQTQEAQPEGRSN